MNNSYNSFINESIHESQTNPINISKNIHMNATIKQNPKIAVTNPKSDDKAFLKIYEQNISLKSKQNQLFKEIMELRQRVNKKDENSKAFLEKQLKQLAKGKKSQWDKVKQPLPKNQGRGYSGNKGLSSNKIEHLLEIIDHYKQKLLTADEQISNLKRQNMLLQQDVKLKSKRIASISQDQPQSNNFLKQQINLSQKLKAKIRQAQMQRQRSKFLQIQIKGLQAKVRSYELKTQQLQSLKSQNRNLQQKIMRLTQINSFSDVIDRAQQQRKVKQLQNKIKMANQKYNNLKDHNIKTQAQLKLIQNKLIQATNQINTLQKQNQTIREQSIHDPILLKIMKEPQLIQKVLYQIQKEKNKQNNKDHDINYKAQVQRIILEKEDLAKQLMAYQNKVQNMESTFKERQKLSRIQKDQAVIAINQPKAVTSRQGIIYQGDTNVFTEQVGNIPSGSNYFDLYLGQVNILQTMVHSTAGINHLGSPLLLATVDFYNHNTEHSKLTQGYRCDMQSQFSFRVNQDDFFIKFIKKGTFQIDIWASQGNKNYNLGKAVIQLKHLASKARHRVSPVISTSAPIYLNQKVMGSINVIMRLRLPIFEQLQKLNVVGTFLSDNKQQIINRRLVIQVEEGRGFGDKSNTFVYYSFRLQDNYTRTSKGNAPNWNFIKLIQVNYDNDFKNFLRKSQVQFIVFDDNVNVLDENSDVVGSSVISLLPLLEGKTIKERLEIKKNNQRKGTIDIKIFWYDSAEGNKQASILKAQEDQKFTIYGLHEQIKQFMKDHSIDAQKIFRMIDWNKTGNISYDEFFQWIMSKISRKFAKDVINTYYKLFKQPVNLLNFTIRVNQELQSQKAVSKSNENIAAGIGMINQFLKINSTHMKKKSLQQFLLHKNILQIAQQIQTDRLGYISSIKLQQYFNKNNIECQLQGQKVKLIDFLKKHQRKDMKLTL